MKNLSKKELDQLLGSYGIFSKKPQYFMSYGEVSYLGGVDLFDEALGGKTFDELPGTTIYLDFRPGGLQITYTRLATNIRLGIKTEYINYIAIESKEAIYAQKEKSVIGRAIIGGLLLGGVGAIVGGMSGIGTKQVKISTHPDNIVTIAVNDQGEEKLLVFAYSDKKKKTVEGLLANFKDKFINEQLK